MRIGLVSIWFERGQAYVAHTIRDALIASGAVKEEDVFVFARTGGVYGHDMPPEKNGYWDVSNLSTFPQYQIPADALARWVRDNQIDHVLFNEEYDWPMVQNLVELGIKCSTYLDYYKPEWADMLELYTSVLCSSWRSFNLVKDHGPAHYIGWGVDSELFKDDPPLGEREFTFFHNAGWFGINMRKGTPFAITAYEAVYRSINSASMLVHCQVDPRQHPMIAPLIQGLEKFPLPKMRVHIGSMPAPGMYHLGQCLVMPTKLEGLGLPLFEAMACGMPVIATDEPPMNEFIEHNRTGWLIPVKSHQQRGDGISFPEAIIDIQELANTMWRLANEPEKIIVAGRAAKEFALDTLSLWKLGKRIATAMGLEANCENK